MVNIKDCKIKNLNNEEFKILQKFMFNNGCSWVGDFRDVHIKEYNSSSIVIELYDRRLKSGSKVVQNVFDALRGQELTFDQFSRKYILEAPIYTKQQMFDFAQFYANNNKVDPNDELLNQFLNP